MVGEVLEGIIVAGLGEGAYFMSMEHYKKEIKEKLEEKSNVENWNVEGEKKIKRKL